MAIAHRIALGITALFLILHPLQFLFAGYGVFSGNFETHEAFGAGLLHLLTLLLVVAFLVARQWYLALLAFLLFAVFFLQIGMVEIGRSNDSPWLSALHPFLAFCYWPFMYFLVWKPARETQPRRKEAFAPMSVR